MSRLILFILFQRGKVSSTIGSKARSEKICFAGEDRLSHLRAPALAADNTMGNVLGMRRGTPLAYPREHLLTKESKQKHQIGKLRNFL
jgi:hypothetical protein